MTASLLIFGYFQLLDLLTTVVFIMHGVKEGNPVVKFALRAAPTPLMGLVFLKLLALALAFYCWRLGRHSLLLRINAMFAFLIAWNLVALLVSSINLL